MTTAPPQPSSNTTKTRVLVGLLIAAAIVTPLVAIATTVAAVSVGLAPLVKASSLGKTELGRIDLRQPTTPLRLDAGRGLEFWIELDTTFEPPQQLAVRLAATADEEDVGTVLCDALNIRLKEESVETNWSGIRTLKYRGRMECSLEPMARELRLSVTPVIKPEPTRLDRFELVVLEPRAEGTTTLDIIALMLED